MAENKDDFTLDDLEKVMVFQEAELEGHQITIDDDKPINDGNDPDKSAETSDDSDNTDDGDNSSSSNTGDSDSSDLDADNDSRRTNVSDDEGDTKTSTPDEDKATINLNKAYFEALKESGSIIVPDDFEFDGSSDELEKVFVESDKLKVEAIRNSIMSSISDEALPLVRHLNAGGTLQDFIDVHSSINLGSIDISKLSNQKKVIDEYYKRTTKYSQDKIDKIINKMIDLDTIEEDAQIYLDDLKDLDVEAAEQRAAQTEREKEQRDEIRRQQEESLATAITTSEFISEKRRGKVNDFFFKPVSYNNGTTTNYNRMLKAISTNPEHLAQLGDILMDSYDLKKGFDMKRFERKGKTSANKTFKDRLSEKINSKEKVSGKTNPTKKAPGWEAVFNQF